MFIFTFLGKVLVGFSYHYINILSSILYSIIMVISGGSRGGAWGSPLLFAPNWGPKKIFYDRPPPLISESGWPSPPSEDLDQPVVIAFNWSNNNYFYK